MSYKLYWGVKVVVFGLGIEGVFGGELERRVKEKGEVVCAEGCCGLEG